jgi:hypothetical protein
LVLRAIVIAPRPVFSIDVEHQSIAFLKRNLKMSADLLVLQSEMNFTKRHATPCNAVQRRTTIYNQSHSCG